MKTLLNHTYTKYLAIILGALLSVGLVTMVTFAETADEFMGSVDGIHVVNPSNAGTSYAVVNGWIAHTFLADGGEIAVRISTDEAGENLVGVTKTGIARQDVMSALGTDLYVGYGWRIPASYHNGQAHAFYVWADSGSSLQLIGSAMMEPSDNGLHGSFDGITGNTVAGWAVDLDGERVTMQYLPVMIFIDGQYVTTTMADKSRMDVENAYPEWGAGRFHGFHEEINVPSDFRNNDWHVVEAFTVETTEGQVRQLAGSHWRYIDQDGLMWTQTALETAQADAQLREESELDTIQF